MMNGREKLLLLILGLAIGFAVFYYLYLYLVAPQISRYQDNLTEIAELRAKITAANAEIASEKEEREQYEIVKKEWNDINKTFSNQMLDGMFLVSLGQYLREQRVVLLTYRSQKIIVQNLYLVLPLDIELSGNYFNIIKVLDFLENQSNLTEISHLTLTSAGEDADGFILAKGDVRAKVTLLVYSHHSPQGKLALSEMQNWQFGKANPFAAPDVYSETASGPVVLQQTGADFSR